MPYSTTQPGYLLFFAVILFICCKNTNAGNEAKPWLSFIPKGYTIRDSTRGNLNLDSIPDFLLVLEADTFGNRLLLLLYGRPGGLYELAASNDKVVYNERMGGASTPDPFDGIIIGAGAFSVEHHGGMSGSFEWTSRSTFRFDSTDQQWYLARTRYARSDLNDTIPMRVTEREEVLDPDNFGKIRFSDFDIYTFEDYNIDADTVEDRFIPYNFFKRQNLALPAVDNQLDSIAALKALFPGRFFKDFEYSENANVIFWICDACPEVKLATNYFSIDGKPEIIEFPDGFANFTHVIGTLTYTEKNTLHKAIFFSTATDYPGSGRFSGGILGIAIFKKNPAEWSLTAFSPDVAVEGTFSTAHTPQKVIHAGNHTFFELDGGNANGAGASYLYREKFIFGLNANVPTLLFHDADGACVSLDRMTHWATNVLPETNPLPFPDLSLITAGFYSKDMDEQPFWDDNTWLKNLQKRHPRQDSFDFKVTRQCRFNGREYKVISTTLE